MADDSLDTTDLAQPTNVLQPAETSDFSQRATNIQQGIFSAQGSDYDIQQAVGSYLAQNGSDALTSDIANTQANLEDALGSQYAEQIALDLDDYSDGTLQYNPAAPSKNTDTGADPVDLATGQFTQTVTDFAVRGAGIDFAFVRTYKSGSFYDGPLGANWDHSANLWIYVNPVDPDGIPTLIVHSGQLRPVFYQQNTEVDVPYFIATGDDHVVVKDIYGNYLRKSPDGRTDLFNNPQSQADGILYQIATTTDRCGNVITYYYTEVDDEYLLTSLNVNNGQRTLTFVYNDQSQIQTIQLFPATYWTASGPTSIGRTWTYAYDDCGDLVSVTGPVTDDFPAGCTTQYTYSSATAYLAAPGNLGGFEDSTNATESSDSSTGGGNGTGSGADGSMLSIAPTPIPLASSVLPMVPHNLLTITDPNGNTYLENGYGCAAGTVAFGRVVSQRVGDGVYYLDWGQVIQDPSWTFSAADCPASCVTVVQRNGHPIDYVLNATGNVLLSRETILGGCGIETLVWRFAYDDDGRRIATLSPAGRITQTYYGREYYYDSMYNDAPPDEVPVAWQDPKLTASTHNTFSNVLATVQRGVLFDLSDFSDDLAFLGDIFPVATQPSALGADIVTKYTYESQFQQCQSSSDPRHTASADPGNSLESAGYAARLTRVTFKTSNGDLPAMPAFITYPTTNYPAALPDGSTGIANAQLSYDAYDANGRLLQYTDPVGNITALSYFPASLALSTLEGFLQSRTIGVGTLNLVTSFTVNEAGQVIAMTDPRGNTTTYAIDARSLVRITTPPLPGYAVNSSYDGNAQVIATSTAVIQPDGTTAPGSPEVKYFSYNCEMSPLVTSYGDSSGTPLRNLRQVYDASNTLIRTVLPRGNSVCYEYDERLLLTRTTRGCCSPAAAATQYLYDADGLRIATIDPRGYATIQTLGPLGDSIGVLYPTGSLQRTDYDKLHNVTVQRWFGAEAGGSYPLLRRTEFCYDERNQLIRTRQSMFLVPIAVADPWGAPDAEYDTAVIAGTVTLYDSLVFRDANLRPFRLVDANGNASTISYDSANRRTTITDPVLSYDAYAYDGAGNITRVDHCCADSTGTMRAVISTGYACDPLNRLTATTDGAGNQVTRALDSRGLILSQTDALGHVSQWTYSPFRERISATQLLLGRGRAPPVALTTTFTYDGNSNSLRVIDPLGNTTATGYDLLDRPILVTNADGTSRSMTYDLSSNRIGQIDEDGITVSQTFDPVNRPSTLTVQSGGTLPASAEQNIALSYDGVGTLVGHQNDFVAVTRSCDSLGRCYAESMTLAAPLNAVPSPLTITRQFDPVSNAMQLQYSSGQTLTYSYNPANRLTQIQSVANATPYPGNSSAPELRSILEKQWWGDLQASATLGNGILLSRAFDAAGRRVADNYALPNGDTLQVQQLWNGAGNRALSVDTLGGSTVGLHYDYDSTNRLNDVVGLNAPRAFPTNAITPPTAPPTVWAPDAQTVIDALIARYALLRAPQSQFVYDSAGNRTLMREGLRTVAYAANSRNEYGRVGAITLTYSPAGRLISDARFFYAYNFRGQLVQASATRGGRSGALVFHDALGRSVGVIEGGRTRVMVPDGMNAIEYYDNGSLSTINIVEGWDKLCFFAFGGKDAYVLRDVLGSTRLTSDSAGAVSGAFRYDAFGVLRGAVPSTPIRYAGKYEYTAMGWYEFALRQYIPVLGRFAQPDPAGFIDGANLYTFVANNPLSARDPTGTDRREVSANSDEQAPLPYLAPVPLVDEAPLPYIAPVPLVQDPILNQVPNAQPSANMDDLTLEQLMQLGVLKMGQSPLAPQDELTAIDQDLWVKTTLQALGVLKNYVAGELGAQLGSLVGAVAKDVLGKKVGTAIGDALGKIGGRDLTYKDGFELGEAAAKNNWELVIGKYPANTRYVTATPGTVTLDVPQGWTGMYNAGFIRGYLESGGSIRMVSSELTGTYGIEVKQILTIPGQPP